MPATILASAAGILMGVGGGLILLGTAANRTHNKLFERHMSNLRHASDRDDDATAREVQRFKNDPALDFCITLMQLEQVGFLLFIVGFGLFLYVWN